MAAAAEAVMAEVTEAMAAVTAEATEAVMAVAAMVKVAEAVVAEMTEVAIQALVVEAVMIPARAAMMHRTGTDAMTADTAEVEAEAANMTRIELSTGMVGSTLIQ